MPPKRENRRGRGGPPDRQEKDVLGGQQKYEEAAGRQTWFPQHLSQRARGGQRFPRQRTPPINFFTEAPVPKEEPVHPQPTPELALVEPEKRKLYIAQSEKLENELRYAQQQKPSSLFFAQPHPPEQQVQHETTPKPALVKEEVKKMYPLDPEELEFENKLALSTPLPVRPEVGTSGRHIQLITNYFSIKVPNGIIYHYDVVINKIRKSESEAEISQVPLYRTILTTKKNREIIAMMLETNQNFDGLCAAYDGQKNLYTRKPLCIQAGETLTCEVILPKENPGNSGYSRGPQQDAFQVKIKQVHKKYANSIKLDKLHACFENKTNNVPQEIIMVLSTVLRHGPSLRFNVIGHYFFHPPNPENSHLPGARRELWFGHHQSPRLGQWTPMVNLDIRATTFYKQGPVLNYIADILKLSVDELRRKPYLTNLEIKHADNELKNMRIEVTHLRNYRRQYRIARVVKESANHLEFTLSENGNTITKTMADYFREHYGRQLKYPNLPCLQVNPEATKIYLPMEVCEVLEGQHYKKKICEKQEADMIKFTARPLDERFREIRDIVRRVDFNHDPHVKDFEIEVSREPLSLEGRVLDAPSVRYNDGVQIRPRDGSWNMQDTQFFRGAVIESWALISFADPHFCPEHQLNKFAEMLTKIGQESGISIDRPTHIRIMGSRRCNMKNLLLEMKNAYKADLVVVVVSSRSRTIYDDIKQVAEIVVGLTTQCVKDDNVVKKCNPQLVSNLCQKINAKMGGVNHSLVPGETPAILRKPVIIIGADVYHPSPTHDIKPSLAACVGSLDCYPSRYAVTCRAQANVNVKKLSREIILDLKSMILELLKAFYCHTKGKKPERIIFYRSGISEGQFERVRDYEVKYIREACKTFCVDYEPGITFIVWQKQNHTRLMPHDRRDGVGRMKNIPPGTIIDTTITHPQNFDFLLCSHFSPQGTSLLRRYTVIEDDNNFTANDLQKLTYYLCHTYARCTKSISVPAPVAYARLAARRARRRLSYCTSDMYVTSDDASSDDFHALPKSVMEATKVLDQLNSTMYFV